MTASLAAGGLDARHQLVGSGAGGLDPRHLLFGSAASLATHLMFLWLVVVAYPPEPVSFVPPPPAAITVLPQSGRVDRLAPAEAEADDLAGARAPAAPTALAAPPRVRAEAAAPAPERAAERRPPGEAAPALSGAPSPTPAVLAAALPAAAAKPGGARFAGAAAPATAVAESPGAAVAAVSAPLDARPGRAIPPAAPAPAAAGVLPGVRVQAADNPGAALPPGPPDAERLPPRALAGPRYAAATPDAALLAAAPATRAETAPHAAGDAAIVRPADTPGTPLAAARPASGARLVPSQSAQDPVPAVASTADTPPSAPPPGEELRAAAAQEAVLAPARTEAGNERPVAAEAQAPLLTASRAEAGREGPVAPAAARVGPGRVAGEATPPARPAGEVLAPDTPARLEVSALPSSSVAMERPATQAWSGGLGARLDPQSLAAVQSFMAPDSGGGAPSVRDGLDAALSELPCSRLAAAFSPETGAILVRGHARDEAIAARALARVKGAVGTSIPVASDLLILPEPQCGVLDAVERLGLPQSSDQADDPLVVGRASQLRYAAFRDGEAMAFELGAADYDAFLYVDYFDAQGGVVHVTPNETAPLSLLPAGGRIVLGGAGAEGIGLALTAAPPFGKDILVAIAISHPLPLGPRATSESGRAYLEELRSAIAEARAAEPVFRGEWVYIFVETLPGDG